MAGRAPRRMKLVRGRHPRVEELTGLRTLNSNPREREIARRRGADGSERLGSHLASISQLSARE